MVEDIGKIISKGFETFTKNLNLGIPFVFSLLISRILDFIFFSIGFPYVLGTSLSFLQNIKSLEQFSLTVFPLIRIHIFEIAALFVLFFLISLFFQSFFMAGAIGMAKQAIETGKSELSAMLDYGKKNVINLYLAEFLIGLLLLFGVVFLIPSALNVNASDLFSVKNGILLLAVGIFVWVIYIVVLSIVFAAIGYALVVDSLDSLDAIITGFKFFTTHKLEVFLLWLITGVISVVAIVGLVILGAIFGMNFIWLLIILVSVLIIAPLTTVWWVRLYMTRTGKKIYFNDLLAHPMELEKLKVNQ